MTDSQEGKSLPARHLSKVSSFMDLLSANVLHSYRVDCAKRSFAQPTVILIQARTPFLYRVLALSCYLANPATIFYQLRIRATAEIVYKIIAHYINLANAPVKIKSIILFYKFNIHFHQQIDITISAHIGNIA